MKHQKIGQLALIVILFLISVNQSFANSQEDSDASSTLIEVDFSDEKDVGNLSGFLGTHKTELVPDHMLFPLKPGLVSVKTVEELARAQELDAQPYTLLSSEWGYPGIVAEHNFKPPFNDIEAWKDLVRERVRLFGKDVTYYIWNEPDMPIFWGLWIGANRDRFYEVFHAAHDVIRDELGEDAKVAGPTFSFLNSDFDAFADYALANDLQIDILSFHLLYQKDHELSEAMTEVDTLKNKFVSDGGRYSALGVKAIHVNEYLRADRQNSRPGSILKFIEHMEVAGVEKASRACWGDPRIPCVGSTCMVTYFVAEWVSPGTCRDGSLTGLLNKKKEPRATWWVYKTYAQGVGTRVKSSSSDESVAVLASREGESSDSAQILIGLTKRLRKSNTITLNLNKLDSLSFIEEGRESIWVKAYLLPYKSFGARVFSELPLLFEERVVVDNNSAVVDITGVGKFEGIFLKIGTKKKI